MEETEWHYVEVWERLAEQCAHLLAKGRLVYVEGRLETERWTDKESGEEQRRLKIVASVVRFLGRRVGTGLGTPQRGTNVGVSVTEVREPKERIGTRDREPLKDDSSFEELPTI